MNSTTLEQIVDAVLYEGYILYPYRPSSKKNRRERFTFGRVYPESYSEQQNGSEPCFIQTECLVETSGAEAQLKVSVCFLHPMAREIGQFDDRQREPGSAEPRFHIVPELRVGKEVFQTWHEAVERRVELPLLRVNTLTPAQHQQQFSFPAVRKLEAIVCGAEPAGMVVRRQAAIRGLVEVSTQPLEPGLVKVLVRIGNQTFVPQIDAADIDPMLLFTFASTHTIMQIQQGEFISLMDPPPRYKHASELCKNIGTWPVLVGDEGLRERHTVLSSPIILYDYPKIAPESAGPLFDGTEIDEILTLRILTMTDEEKSEMRRVDEQARQLLERTEALGQDSLLQLHGVMRRNEPVGALEPSQKLETGESRTPIEFDDFFGAATALTGVSVGGTYLRAGSRVRIRPKARADLLDLALDGQTAVIEAVEQDAEKRIHLAVVFENDPGKDLGMLRQPGHRFFYGIEEVEPLSEEPR